MSGGDDTVFEFPCEFPLKIIGKDTASFHRDARAIVGRHVEPADRGEVSARPSRGGRYVALSLTVRVHSRAQLEALYRDLGASREVLWVL